MFPDTRGKSLKLVFWLILIMISTVECDGNIFGFMTAKKSPAALEEKLVIEVNHNAQY